MRWRAASRFVLLLMAGWALSELVIYCSSYFFLFDDYALVSNATDRSAGEILGRPLIGFYRPLVFLLMGLETHLFGRSVPAGLLPERTQERFGKETRGASHLRKELGVGHPAEVLGDIVHPSPVLTLDPMPETPRFARRLGKPAHEGARPARTHVPPTARWAVARHIPQTPAKPYATVSRHDGYDLQ